MKITCVSDLHGEYPALQGGDLLIVAGDLTASDMDVQYPAFYEWLDKQQYECKVVTAGNHDNRLHPIYIDSLPGAHYLQDSFIHFEGYKIYGTPWTKSFFGINSFCRAFMLPTEKDLAAKWALIPDDIDILVTHGPPHGVMDLVRSSEWRRKLGIQIRTGSTSLNERSKSFKQLKLWTFGHIHEGYGQITTDSGCIMVNCSHMDRDYRPVNEPVNVNLLY